MAEAKESEGGFEVWQILAIIAVIVLFGGRLLMYIDNPGSISDFILRNTGGESGWYTHFLSIAHSTWGIYTIIATIFSILAFLGIAYASIRMRQLSAEEEELQKTPEISGKQESEMVAKWVKVVHHVNSDNPAEWRLAILEADVMLEEMLDSMSYAGDTVGEKLKNIEKSEFTTIEYAWEAHKIRNAIAHEGADFLITQREAKRVISLFEKVFKEFYYI